MHADWPKMADAVLHAQHECSLPPAWRACPPGDASEETSDRSRQPSVPQRLAPEREVRSCTLCFHDTSTAAAWNMCSISSLPCRFCRMSRMLSSSTAGHTAEAEAPTGVSGKPEVSSNGAGREAAALTFQEAIARLQSYWASVGCAVWQPFNSEVGLPSENSIPWLAPFQTCASLGHAIGLSRSVQRPWVICKVDIHLCM